MTDRELLELAAKAVGIDTSIWHDHVPAYWVDDDLYWNPLTDDGDTLRLAVKLRLTADISSDSVEIFYCGDCIHDEEVRDDPYAATRRAIVRAAAEIGKALP